MTKGAPAIGVPAIDGSVDPDRLVGAIEAGGAVARVTDPDALLECPGDLDAILAAGTDGLRTVATRRSAVPVLPVAADCGLPSVPLDDLESAVAEIVAGATDVESAPLLAVSVDGETATTAYREVTLITAEPARISEFAIRHDGEGRLDTVRADGVVVATPAGSRGYAAAGDGPLLSPGTGLAIVPVAPFRTDRDRWVVPVASVSVCVQRDEATVTVEADGEVLATVGRDAEVSLTPAGTLDVLVVDESTRESQ